MVVDTFPLPEGWSTPEVLTDSVTVDGLAVHRAGISTKGPSGEELVGAAVEAAGPPLERAYFELLERVSTVQALRPRVSPLPLFDLDGGRIGALAPEAVFPVSDDPTRWRYARSNGVAIHVDWAHAAERALWELAERDRLLRAWYGETRPELLPASLIGGEIAGTQSFEWRAYAFPASSTDDFAPEVSVVGVYGLPSIDELPLICGYGARRSTTDAVCVAAREALQALGFLWGEPVADSVPAPEPTPLTHLEHYQFRGARPLLRKWLELGHGRYRGGRGGTSRPDRKVGFVDLTPGWLSGGLRVVKAVCDAAMPLAFGHSPFGAHLPPELRLHPIG